MKSTLLPKSIFLFILLIGHLGLRATHIRGGQIFYEKINFLTFQITFVGYRDQKGVLFDQGLFDFGDGSFFGDDTDEVIPWVILEDLGNGIERWEFTLVHTFPSSGAFVTSYTEGFRAWNINNMEESINTSFHVEAMILLDPLISNNSPRSYESLDMVAIAGTKFTTNLMMYDDEGDSLSYDVVIPLKSRDMEVDGYRYPSDLQFYAEWIGDELPVYHVDPFTGNLTWDVPMFNGFYAIALRTNEWRKVNGEIVKVGSTTVDYLIEVIDIVNFHSIRVPETSCQPSNTGYSDQISISNDQNQELSISIFTPLEGVTFNGLTSEEWNGGSQIFTEDEIIIDIDILPEDTEAGFYSIYIRVNVSSSAQESITFTSGFSLGIGCTPEDLIVLGTEQERHDVSMSFSKEGIHISSERELVYTLHIHDLSSKKLWESDMVLVKGDNVVNYAFKPYHLYFILLDYKKGSITEKVLLTK